MSTHILHQFTTHSHHYWHFWQNISLTKPAIVVATPVHWHAQCRQITHVSSHRYKPVCRNVRLQLTTRDDNIMWSRHFNRRILTTWSRVSKISFFVKFDRSKKTTRWPYIVSCVNWKVVAFNLVTLWSSFWYCGIYVSLTDPAFDWDRDVNHCR